MFSDQLLNICQLELQVFWPKNMLFRDFEIRFSSPKNGGISAIGPLHSEQLNKKTLQNEAI